MNIRRLHPGFLTALWLLPLLALLQAGLVQHFAVRGIVPSIVVIAVINWGILRGADEGMLWGLIGGSAVGVLSGWPFGTSAVALVIVASLVSLGQGTFMRTHALVPLLTMFGATILYYLIALVVLSSIHQPVNWTQVLWGVVIPTAGYNALLNIPGFRLTEWLERRIYPMPRANW